MKAHDESPKPWSASLRMLEEMELNLSDVNEYAKDCRFIIEEGIEDLSPTCRVNATVGMALYLKDLTAEDRSEASQQLNHALKTWLKQICPWFCMANSLADEGVEDINEHLSILQLTSATIGESVGR